jgi:hypothetical protein
MMRAFIVFRVFTTRASGKARWICSPSESVLVGVQAGWHTLAEVQRVGYIHQHLTLQVFGSCQLQGGNRGHTTGTVEQHLALGGCLGKGLECDCGIIYMPNLER